MARQGPNAAQFGLGKEWIICQPVLLQQAPQGPGATAKAQRIDGQDGYLRVNVVAWITGARILACHGLTHNHPQGIRGGDVVSTSQHEFVAERMFGLAVVIAQATELRPGQMDRDVVWCVGQRPTKMPCLGIVPEQHQGHAGHVPNVLNTLAVVVHLEWLYR